jgi:hypothetical protein
LTEKSDGIRDRRNDPQGDHVPQTNCPQAGWTKEFLDGELAKHEAWADIRSNRSIRTILSIDNGQAFAKLKGAGRTTILKFLGSNWKQWVIQEALSTLNDSSLDREAVEMMPSVKKAIPEAGVTKKEHKKLWPKRLLKTAKAIDIQRIR